MANLSVRSSKKIELVYQLLLAVIIFLIPANLFLKFFENTAYVNGLLVDYLLPKLYLSDIVILVLFAIWILESWQSFRVRFSPALGIFFVLLVALFSRQFFTDKPLAAVWFFTKLLEMSALAIFLYHHKNILSSRIVGAAWGIMVGFQSFVAIFQFLFQRSILGFYFLGEPSFVHRIILAKGTFNGEVRVLPYGTTAHPNILAGVSVVGVLVMLMQFWQKKKLSRNAAVFGSVMTLLLPAIVLYCTQSVSAALTLSVGIVMLGLPFPLQSQLGKFTPAKVVIFCTAFFLVPIAIHFAAQFLPDNLSVIRREELQIAAVKMIVKNPLFGVGLNNFTANVEKYHPNTEVVRFVQPAHHVGMLWLAETGVLGVMIILMLGFFLRRKKILLPLIILFPILTLDHYLLTQQTGLLLGVFFLSHFMDSGLVRDSE